MLLLAHQTNWLAPQERSSSICEKECLSRVILDLQANIHVTVFPQRSLTRFLPNRFVWHRLETQVSMPRPCCVATCSQVRLVQLGWLSWTMGDLLRYEHPADLDLFSLSSFELDMCFNLNFLVLSHSTEFCFGYHPVTGLQLFKLFLAIFYLILSWDSELQRCIEYVSCVGSLCFHLRGRDTEKCPDRLLEFHQLRSP